MNGQLLKPDEERRWSKGSLDNFRIKRKHVGVISPFITGDGAHLGRPLGQVTSQLISLICS